MSTTATPYQVVLDPKAYAGIHLVESDGEPMETILHRDCMWLLIVAATYHNLNRGRQDFLVGGNNFIYFNPDQARNRDYRGPDFFYVKDGVDRSRQRQYWAVWEENGRLPDVVLELLSPTTEEEDRTTKFAIYEQTLRTPEYFLYDPFSRQLEGFRLVDGTYRPLQPDERGWMWSEEMQAWLGHWEGEFLGTTATYLRLYTPEGNLVLLPDEAAQQQAEQERQRTERARQRTKQERQRTKQEQQRADQEHQRADQEHQRADQEQQRAEEQQQRAEEQQQRAEEQQQRAEEQQQRAEEQQQRADQERRRAEEAERELARLKALLEQRQPKADAEDEEKP